MRPSALAQQAQRAAFRACDPGSPGVLVFVVGQGIHNLRRTPENEARIAELVDRRAAVLIGAYAPRKGLTERDLAEMIVADALEAIR